MKRGAFFKEDNGSHKLVPPPQSDLIIAVKFGNIEQITDLVKNKQSDVNETDSWDISPLMVAASNTIPNQFQTITKLLELGAEADAKDLEGETALMMARKGKHQDAVKAITTFNVGDNFVKLPDELFKTLLGYLPAYSFRGKRCLNQVSVYFNDFLENHPALTNGKDIKEIVATCKTQEDAINILSDDALFDQLSYKNLLRIISFIPDLARTLINTNDLIKTEDLEMLGQSNLGVATEMLSNLTNRQHIMKLVEYHPTLAEHVIKTPSLINGFIGSDRIGELVQSNLLAAELMMKMEIFSDQLYKKNDIVLLAQHHLSLAQDVFSKPDILNSLSGDDLAVMCCYHGILVKKVLDTKELRDKLDSGALANIIINNVEAITRVFESAELFSRLDADDIIAIGCVQESIAMKILTEATFAGILNSHAITRLGFAHEKAAMYILQIPSLLSQLQANDISIIGFRHEKAATHIFEDLSFRQKMSLRDIIDACAPHPSLAKKVLQHFSFWHSFKKMDLICLGKSSYSNAQYILNNAVLCKKLDPQAMLELARHYYPIAQSMLDKYYDLAAKPLSKEFPSIAKLVQMKSMDEAIKAEIEDEATIYDIVKEFVVSNKLKETNARRHKY